MRLFLVLGFSIALQFLLIGCPKNKDVIEQQKQSPSEVVKEISAPSQIFSPEIIAEHPHDSMSYTQGLFIVDGMMYESAGLYGQSSLSETNIKTWKQVRRTPIEARYFAEGSVMLNGKLFVLTYQEHTCFVYDPLSFTPQASFGYEGEGWGLTTDGEKLYMSNGSDKITVRNPNTFGVESTIQVTDGGAPIERINELEWVNGTIWANIYQSDNIAIIDPKSGIVKSWLNCSELRSRTKGQSNAEVLNGIAYNPKSNTLFLTGKNWGTLFEIKPL